MRITILFCLLLFSFGVLAQSPFNKYNIVPDTSAQGNSSVKQSQIHYSLQVGTSIGSYGKDALYRNYLAPTISYDLSERFTLSGGIVSSVGNSLNLSTYDGNMLLPVAGTLMQNMVFASGSYQLNEKVRLFGTGYYEINRFSLAQDNAQNSQFDTKGMSFGFEYKLSKSASIQFEFQQGNGNPYGRSAVGNQRFGRQNSFSPFY